jgi:glycosyltransferase involved in cell wall biosynthesis
MGKEPRVSVVVTTYNQAPFIASTLESVFAQSRQADEVIVVDDGSTDETPERIAPYRDRIVLLRQPNQGVARSRNAGIQRAGGELLAFLDGDDLWEAEKLALQIAAANAHPDSGLIAVDGVQFTDAGIMRQSLFPAQIASLFVGDAESVSLDVSRQLLEENVIWTTSQVMIPARVLKAVGLSDPEFSLVNDWDLYLRIAEQYPVTFLHRRLTRWRYHERSASGPTFLRELRWGEDSIRMLARHVRQVPGERRRAVRAALRSRVFMTAEAAYNRTKPGQRELGLSCLWRLLRWSRVSAAPAMFLLAAYSPAWLTRPLGRLARAALRVVRST